MGIISNKFKVLKTGHLISQTKSYSLELNFMSWFGGKGKYDIRKWNGPEPQKGVTLTGEELNELLDAICSELGMKAIRSELYDALIIEYKNKEVEENKDAELSDPNTIEHVEQIFRIDPRADIYVRKCENCMLYKKEECGGLKLCDDYVFSPTIPEDELAMWPTMGDASYLRTHGNLKGRR